MTGILVTHFLILLFIFIRILAALVTAPLFNNRAIPVMAKIALSLVISYIIFSFIDNSAIKLEFSIWFIIINTIKEVLTGAIIGFSVNLLFHGISFAGTLMGFDIGLSMAQIFNPVDETNNNVIGETYNILAILILILINGHHYIIRGLAYSFTVVPLGTFSLNENIYDYIIKLGSTVFILAVKIASPILVSFFLIHIAEGIMAKTMPQMQVFFVTYPVKIGLGIFLIIASFPLYVYVIKNLLSTYEDELYKLIQMMG